jgi:MFS family permease
LVLPLSGILIPVGLGICGATLEYHKHYIGYAIGIFVVGAATLISIPAATNYVAESFPLYGTECTLIMTFYRLSWGVAIPFFIKPWTVQVGIGWVYGMAGFFTIAMWFPVLLLVWKGPTLRRWSLMKGSVSPEDGMALFEM